MLVRTTEEAWLTREQVWRKTLPTAENYAAGKLRPSVEDVLLAARIDPTLHYCLHLADNQQFDNQEMLILMVKALVEQKEHYANMIVEFYRESVQPVIVVERKPSAKPC